MAWSAKRLSHQSLKRASCISKTVAISFIAFTCHCVRMCDWEVCMYVLLFVIYMENCWCVSVRMLCSVHIYMHYVCKCMCVCVFIYVIGKMQYSNFINSLFSYNNYSNCFKSYAGGIDRL